MRTGVIHCLGPHGFHRTRYTEWGDPANPHVVVCVHGLTRNGRDFDALATRLSRKARVVCPDIVGRGTSDRLSHPSDYGYPQYLADLTALIARSGADTVDWVGTSMGGLIGMLMAVQPGAPIRRLVMNDVGPFVPQAALEVLATYVGKAPSFDDTAALEQYLRQVFSGFGALTDVQWRHLAEHSARRDDDGRITLAYDPAIGAALTGPLQDVDLWSLWPALRTPVLVIR
ncbi:MAG: alpha/beta hydrolase, partial [Burkholderiales bacterium]|nr:alpha/beta hydrolase [Burkholderiales bacterium]